MNALVGISVQHEIVRAVALRRGSIVWAATVTIDGRSVREVILELIDAAGAEAGRIGRIRVAVGPGHSQLKCLQNLPDVQSPVLLEQLVAENSSRFFLRNGVPLLTTAIRVRSGEGTWAGAIEREAVNQITEACRDARLALDLITPAAVALAYAVDEQRFAWTDGPYRLEVAHERGTLLHVRRRPAPETEAVTELRVIEALSTLGGDASAYAAAYGAALLPDEEPLVLRAGKQIESTSPPARWRLPAAVLALCLAALAIVVGPPMAALARAADAEELLIQFDRERRAAFTAEDELRKVTQAVNELGEFAASAGSATALLADLGSGFPQGSALVSLRVNDSAGSVIALSPRAAAVVEALEGVSGVSAVEFTGPVTREDSQGMPLERVTLRFRIEPQAVAIEGSADAREPGLVHNNPAGSPSDSEPEPSAPAALFGQSVHQTAVPEHPVEHAQEARCVERAGNILPVFPTC